MLRNILRTTFSKASAGNARSLYSASALGLDGYEQHRERTKVQYMHNVDNFKTKMKEFVAGSSTNMIFTEDLKNIIHLADDNPDDKKLLVSMIEKYNSQAPELRFGNFIFGPVVMRAIYYLKDPVLGMKLFKDEKFSGFFDQLSSYQILGDLLYEHGLYREVRELFDIIKDRQNKGARYPKHAVTLTFAACYKENSEEAFQYAMALWRELNSIGQGPMRKATAFAAALALNHNKPGIALEIVGTVVKANYITIRQLKILALVAMERLDELIPIFRMVLEVNTPLEHRQTFCKEVIDKVKHLIGNTKAEVPQDLVRLLEYLETNNQIIDTRLDDILCQEVVTEPRKEMSSNLANSFRSRGGSQQSRRFQPSESQRSRFHRPGLAEMS